MTTQSDLGLAKAALEKRREGKSPTRDEAAALRRIEKQKDHDLRRKHYASISKKDYRDLCGRQDKVLNEQAAEYGIPIGGAAIDLGAVLTWMHNFLAENKFKLKALSDDDAANLIGASQSLKDEYLREKIKVTREQAIKAQLERKHLERTLIPLDFLHETLGKVAGILRSLGGRLERRLGHHARKMLDDALDNAQRQINALIGHQDNPHDGAAVESESRK